MPREETQSQTIPSSSEDGAGSRKQDRYLQPHPYRMTRRSHFVPSASEIQGEDERHHSSRSAFGIQNLDESLDPYDSGKKWSVHGGSLGKESMRTYPDPSTFLLQDFPSVPHPPPERPVDTHGKPPDASGSFFNAASNIAIRNSHFTSHGSKTDVTMHFYNGMSDGRGFNNQNRVFEVARNSNTIKITVPNAQSGNDPSQAGPNPHHSFPPAQQPEFGTKDNSRSNVLYEKHLCLKGRGHPLWIPQPNTRLPTSYRKRGISIGDVGIFTADGGFDFLFNICVPTDDPMNPKQLPNSFAPLEPPLDPIDIREFKEFQSGSYLGSSAVAKSKIGIGPSGGLSFEPTASQGAILIMPDGAYLEDLNNVSTFRQYVGTCAESWYRFATGPRGREIKNGELRLITGCDKASSWGMAAFANLSTVEDVHLSFSTTSRRWDHSGPAEVRAGPEIEDSQDLKASGSTSRPLRNQCLFVRSLAVTLSQDCWTSLHAPSTNTHGAGIKVLRLADLRRQRSERRRSLHPRIPNLLPILPEGGIPDNIHLPMAYPIGMAVDSPSNVGELKSIIASTEVQSQEIDESQAPIAAARDSNPPRSRTYEDDLVYPEHVKYSARLASTKDGNWGTVDRVNSHAQLPDVNQPEEPDLDALLEKLRSGSSKGGRMAQHFSRFSKKRKVQVNLAEENTKVEKNQINQIVEANLMALPSAVLAGLVLPDSSPIKRKRGRPRKEKGKDQANLAEENNTMVEQNQVVSPVETTPVALPSAVLTNLHEHGDEFEYTYDASFALEQPESVGRDIYGISGQSRTELWPDHMPQYPTDSRVIINDTSRLFDGMKPVQNAVTPPGKHQPIMAEESGREVFSETLTSDITQATESWDRVKNSTTLSNRLVPVGFRHKLQYQKINFLQVGKPMTSDSETTEKLQDPNTLMREENVDSIVALNAEDNPITLLSAPSSNDMIGLTNIVNDYLLKKFPHAKMAVTNDKDWSSVLSSVSEKPQPSEILAAILVSHEPRENNGIAFFETKEDFIVDATILKLLHSFYNGHETIESYLFGPGFLDRKLLVGYLLREQMSMVHSAPRQTGSVIASFPLPLKGHPFRNLSLTDIVKIFDAPPDTEITIERISDLRNRLRSYTANHPDRTSCIHQLANALFRRFSTSRRPQMDDLDETIWYLEACIKLASDDHYLYLEAVIDLCSAIHCRIQLLHHDEDRERLLSMLKIQQEIDVSKLLNPLRDFLGRSR